MMPARNLFLMIPVLTATAQTLVDGRPGVVLEGRVAQAAADVSGGSIVQFQFKDQRLNPLSWTSEEPGPAHPMGHFLCLDRWGAPSEAESRNGMPFHGEASHVLWGTVHPPERTGGVIRAEMSASLPLAGITVQRRIELLDGAALLHVSESVTNNNKLGRIYN